MSFEEQETIEISEEEEIDYDPDAILEVKDVRVVYPVFGGLPPPGIKAIPSAAIIRRHGILAMLLLVRLKRGLQFLDFFLSHLERSTHRRTHPPDRKLTLHGVCHDGIGKAQMLVVEALCQLD